MKTAIYPGSFDPITLGHLDIIERAASLFTNLIVVVMHNGNKHPIFTPEERVEYIQRVTAHLPNITVKTHCGLLADYAEAQGACTIVKGLRAVSDFDNEFQMALANRHLNSNVDTVFLMTSAEYMYLSSSVVKDIAVHGGSIHGFVSPELEQELTNRLTMKRKDD